MEKNIARKIVAAADISRDDKVVEIGPGKGILSGFIAPLAREFKAVEIDKTLFEGLKEQFSAFPGARIDLADFLEYPFSAEPGPLKIVANLPYNVSTAIIEKFLPEHNWTDAVIMVQKEVGERITALPGTKEYGSFGILCGYYAGIKKLFSVGPGCFFPKPKVDSVVLKFTSRFSPRLESGLISFLRASFSQRRKTAVNSVSSSLEIPKADVLKAFELSRIDPALRPENMDLSQFSRLYKNLSFTFNK